MTRYIRLNPLKQTLKEDLRIVPSWKVLLLWIPKLLRKKREFSSAFPVPLPSVDFVVKREDVPPIAAARLTKQIEESTRLGFSSPVYQVCRTLGGESVTTVANCRHVRAEIVLRHVHVRLGIINPPREVIATTLMSRLADGRRLSTSDRRASYDSTPNVIAQRLVGGSLEALLALHQQKLDELRQTASPEKAPDDPAMLALCDVVEREALEFRLQRGLYEELSPEEVAAESARTAARQKWAGADVTNIDVLAQIEKLENRRANWSAAVSVALLSCLAFIMIGGTHWNWEFALILTGVVAFHELGHYVAMRIFRYKDVRMFFLPLLGAAVTGRHYNVKGWQRAVVSLAGPVPGIVLGLMLAGLALKTHNHLVERTALIALLINGINLIPFVPLDGGWVLHALVFSRHYVLETAFMALAGLALIAATLLGQGSFGLYLGILMLIGVPSSYRVARLAGRLRTSGIAKTSPDDQSIPPETALTILHELKKDPKSMPLTKQLAGQTLDVFQKLNATPPGLSATMLLLLVYWAAGMVAFLGVKAVSASRASALEAAAFPPPTRSVDPARVRVNGWTNETDFEWLSPLVLATFTNTDEAEKAFRQATTQAGARDRLTLFGQSVFVSGAGASNDFRAFFKKRGAQVLIELPASNLTATIVLSCHAPDESTATTVQRDEECYFNGAWLGIWPPWANLAGMEPAKVERIERSRHTWSCLHEVDGIVARDPEYQKLFKTGPLFLKKKTPADWMKEAEKELALRQALYHRELSKLTNSTDRRLDLEMVGFYDRVQCAAGTNQEEARQTMQHFLAGPGSLPLNGNLPASRQAWRAAKFGASERTQSTLNFRFVNYYRTDFGLPDMVAYLQRNGCTDFRYEIQGVVNEED